MFPNAEDEARDIRRSGRVNLRFIQSARDPVGAPGE